MIIPDELKLNRFKQVNIPTNREYFSRYGFGVVSPDHYTGDEHIGIPCNKVEALRRAEIMLDSVKAPEPPEPAE